MPGAARCRRLKPLKPLKLELSDLVSRYSKLHPQPSNALARVPPSTVDDAFFLHESHPEFATGCCVASRSRTAPIQSARTVRTTHRRHPLQCSLRPPWRCRRRRGCSCANRRSRRRHLCCKVQTRSLSEVARVAWAAAVAIALGRQPFRPSRLRGRAAADFRRVRAHTAPLPRSNRR